MKVLHLLMSNKFSGAENVVCQIIECCNGYEMAYCSSRGEIEEELKQRGINYIPLEKKNIYSIKKVVESYKPDIIHAHDFTASVLASQIGFKGKLISHLHNNAPFIKKWGIKSIIYNLTICNYDSLILVSNSIYNEAVFRKKIKDKYSVVYNYVDADGIMEKSNTPSDIASDIAFVGRLTEAKNPIGFIDIIKGIKEEFPDIKTIMLGDGELREECKKKIEKEHLENNIEMLGFVENPYSVIKNTKIVIMPSRWEGFGLVAIEAMILGKIVFASNAGGLKEIFIDDEEFLFDANEKVIDKVIALLRDNEQYELKKQALNCITTAYTNKSQWIDKLKELYSK